MNNMVISPEVFEKNICKNVCKICVPKDVSFCILLANADPQGFADFLLYVNILFETNNKLRFELNSFEAFSGIVCDYLCPIKTDSCVPYGNQMRCYETFLIRCGQVLTTKMKANILEKYSGIPQLQIGIDFEIYDLDRLITLLKAKTRKRLFKKVKKAMENIGFKKLSVNTFKMAKTANIAKIVKAKEVHTSIFFNKNREWESKLHEIIGLT